MKRRQNKSHKVPGVKLRPAQEGSYKSVAARQTASLHLVEDSQVGSDDTAIYDTCPRPFRGVVLCATGIPDKPTLFKQAIELGAVTLPVFTDKVTHLVAAEHGSPKYYCAVQRKVPVLMPSWITESYQTWLKGDDVDLEESIRHHRLPIFSGVVLSLSGVDDPKLSRQIERQLTKHHGTFMKNLERPVRVTHLLCSGDEDTEKMRYAEKFNKNGEANIHLVWEEWFWDSIEFGGRFDESAYQARCPRPERKTIEESVTPPPSSVPPASSSGPTTTSENSKSSSSVPPQQEDLDEEVASKKQIPAVALHLWSSLLKTRGYDLQDGRLLRSPSKPKPAKGANIPAYEDLEDGQPLPGKSVISSFRRTNSFAPVESKAASSGRQPFKRTTTNTALFQAQAQAQDNPVAKSVLQPFEKVGETSAAGAVAPPSASADSRQPEPSRIFNGLRFFPRGEARSATVKTAIAERGGTLVSEVENEHDVDYIIVRLVSGSKLYREEADDGLRGKYRTECWLERCLFEDRICTPDEHITFLPLAVELPIIGTEHINLSTSGFDQSELCWLSRLLRALGINLAKSFSRRSTLLLCPSGTGAKYDKAKEWKIPVIGMAWLCALIEQAQVPSAEAYEVPPGGETQALPTHPQAGTGERVAREEPAARQNVTIDAKGKGKARADENFNDITNSNDRSNVPNNRPASPKKLQKLTSTIPSRPTSPQKASIFGKPDEALLRSILPPPLSHSTSSSSTSSATSSTSSFKLDPNAQLLRTPRRSQQSKTGKGDPPTRPNSAASTPTRTPGGRVRSRSQFLSSQNQLSQNQPSQRQVPSSRSPSPMKMPPKANEAKRRPISRSPTKVIVDPDAAKALQDSITSLLGKRPSEEDAGATSGGSGAAGRKRPRPQRIKPATRQTTADLVTSLPSFDAALAAVTSDIKSITSPFEPFGGDTSVTSDSRLRAGGSPGAMLNGEGESGIRVMYEDPQQVDERKRLMNLLKSQVDGGNEEDRVGIEQERPVREMRPRRSLRNAAF